MDSVVYKTWAASLLAIGAAAAGHNAVAGPDDVLRWRTVIGIAQANNVVGSGSGTVTGGGQPWSALDGHAVVEFETGEIGFDVRGLVLAGGNSIGTPGAINQVRGSLVCDTDGSASGGNSVIVDTPLVRLDGEGNARFNGNVGALPAVCASEPDVAFVIRVASGRWIANGTVLR